MNPQEDPRLLQDCLQGSPGAWEAFVRRFAPFLAEVCRRTLKRCGRPAGSQEVADMLQEVLLVFLERDLKVLRGYRGRGTVASYLATVAVRTVLADRSLEGTASTVPDLEAPAAESLEAKEARELLHREVERLPARSRLALTLQAEGASLKEVGGALGISPDAAAHLLARARAELKARFGKS